MILAIASGLLFSVGATDMLAGQIGVAKGKRMPMVQASGGRLYWLMLLPVLPAIPSYVLMWRAGDVYRADRRYSQWRLFCCCRRFSEPCFFCMIGSTWLRCHRSGQDYRGGKWFVLFPCAMATALVWELLLSCLYVLLARELVLC